MAVNKEIDLRFMFGYTPLEFRDTLHMLAEAWSTPGRAGQVPSGLPVGLRACCWLLAGLLWR